MADESISKIARNTQISFKAGYRRSYAFGHLIGGVDARTERRAKEDRLEKYQKFLDSQTPSEYGDLDQYVEEDHELRQTLGITDEDIDTLRRRRELDFEAEGVPF